MWLQRYTHYLFNHLRVALALTFFSTFIPVVGVFGILFASLVTLRKGALKGLVFTLAATLPYLASFYLSDHHEKSVPIMMWAALGVAMLSNVLTYALAILLNRKASWSSMLQVSALLGVLFISVVHLVYPNVAEWWMAQLSTYYNEATTAVSGVLSGAVADATDVQMASINVTKFYATGVLVVAVLLNAVMQLIVARWWQGLVYHAGLLKRELHHITLSKLAGVLFVLSLALSYWGNTVVLDIMPVLYVLFTAAGLSVVHCLFGNLSSPARLLWLSLVYITLILALPTSMLLVSMLALFDIWFDIRKRFGKV